MVKRKIFISFDYHHDLAPKGLLVGHILKPNTQLSLVGFSTWPSDNVGWQSMRKSQIANSDFVIILCGRYTNRVSNVATELKIAQQLKKPYLLLRASKNEKCVPPKGAKVSDKIHDLDWSDLDKLILQKCKIGPANIR